jgi:hypothetical protein
MRLQSGLAPLTARECIAADWRLKYLSAVRSVTDLRGTCESVRPVG